MNRQGTILYNTPRSIGQILREWGTRSLSRSGSVEDNHTLDIYQSPTSESEEIAQWAGMRYDEVPWVGIEARRPRTRHDTTGSFLESDSYSLGATFVGGHDIML